jgi:hypothetical protein
MMVPVVVREAEHPDPAYFRAALEVKREPAEVVGSFRAAESKGDGS